jgi:ribonuclease J
VEDHPDTANMLRFLFKRRGLTAEVADSAEDALKKLKGEERDDDEAVETALSRALKRASQQIWDRRPVVEVTVLRI